MHLSHINVTMPKGSEDIARSFYGGHLGLREIPKPEPLRVRGGVSADMIFDVPTLIEFYSGSTTLFPGTIMSGYTARIAELAVRWVMQNLDPAKLPPPSYQR